jgi:hypothetical protein
LSDSPSAEASLLTGSMQGSSGKDEAIINSSG